MTTDRHSEAQKTTQTRPTGSKNRANLANIDVLCKLYKDGDDVRPVVNGSVVHQSHSSLVMFAKSRWRTLVTQCLKHWHETSLCRHTQTHSHALQSARRTLLNNPSHRNRATLCIIRKFSDVKFYTINATLAFNSLPLYTVRNLL